MELKSIVQIEVERNDRKYTFSMPVGVSYGEAYDAAFEVLQKTVELAQKAAESTRPPQEQQQ